MAAIIYCGLMAHLTRSAGTPQEARQPRKLALPLQYPYQQLPGYLALVY